MVIPTVQLNNGLKMPAIGLGTFTPGPDDMVNIIKTAIDCGYRHFDTALVYQTEKYLGQAIREKIAEGAVKREDLFIVTKLWSTYHRPDLVIKGCKKSLKNLGLDYIDLYLIHWPVAFKPAENPDDSDKDNQEFAIIMDNPDYFPCDENKKMITTDNDYLDTWKEMEKCVDMGLTKSIGVSNFNSVQIDRLLKNSRIKPVTNQVEVHPYFNQKKMIDFCEAHNIIVIAYGPLGTQMSAFKPDTPKVLDNPKIIAIAQELNKTPAQVILRYLVQHNTVPIPKADNLKRLTENISIFDFNLSPEQMAEMDLLDCKMRFCIIPGIEDHKDYPFTVEF